jgi:hypothetical protein
MGITHTAACDQTLQQFSQSECNGISRSVTIHNSRDSRKWHSYPISLIPRERIQLCQAGMSRGERDEVGEMARLTDSQHVQTPKREANPC